MLIPSENVENGLVLLGNRIKIVWYIERSIIIRHYSLSTGLSIIGFMVVPNKTDNDLLRIKCR